MSLEVRGVSLLLFPSMSFSFNPFASFRPLLLGLAKYSNISYSAFPGGMIFLTATLSTWFKDLGIEPPPFLPFPIDASLEIPVPEFSLYVNDFLPLEFTYKPADERLFLWGLDSEDEVEAAYDRIIAKEFTGTK